MRGVKAEGRWWYAAEKCARADGLGKAGLGQGIIPAVATGIPGIPGIPGRPAARLITSQWPVGLPRPLEETVFPSLPESAPEDGPLSPEGCSRSRRSRARRF